MIALRVAIALLCAAGFAVSLHMFRKSRLAERGLLAEPSIVEEPHARLFFGIPNALFGCFYYPALAAAVWFCAAFAAPEPYVAGAVRGLAFALLALATATSAFLAVSLLFITRRPCPYCWANHAINLLLLCGVPWALLA